MVRFLTEDYKELDVIPSIEFELIMENPMLDSENIPTPFSTQIGFPASPANNKIFGYIPVMMQSPEVKTLPVTILISGIPLISGKLKYDGIDDGLLNYTFTSAPLNGIGSKKIWEESIWPFDLKAGPFNGQPNNPAVVFPLMINATEVANFPRYRKYQNGSGFFSGGRIVSSTTSKVSTKGIPDHVADKIEEGRRFERIVESYYKFLTPVIMVSAILDKIPELKISLKDKTFFDSIGIVGRYHKFLTNVKDSYSDVSGQDGENTKSDMADYLPDITFSDLLGNIGRIFCASVFCNGRDVELVPNSDALEDSDFFDIDSKVSDIFSCKQENPCSYVFGFSDDGKIYDRKKITEDVYAGKIIEIDNKEGPEAIVKAFTSKEYKTVWCSNTERLYSGKNDGTKSPKEWLCACDLVCRQADKIKNIAKGADVSERDNSSNFYLVRTIPERIKKDKHIYNKVSVIYEPLKIGDSRDDKVFIGTVISGQMTDDGYFCPVTKKDCDLQGAYSLVPKILYEKYHKTFAKWLEKERQLVNVELNFSPYDIAGFKMSRPVYFRGRKWVTKKLSCTIRPDSGIVSGTGEFVSL